jgi:hypothetical protein
VNFWRIEFSEQETSSGHVTFCCSVDASHDIGLIEKAYQVSVLHKNRTDRLHEHEVVSKIFRTDAAIYTEVVVARSTGPNRPNLNSGFYCDVLRLLRENVRRCRPELWREQTWLLHHDNAPFHTSVPTQQFLAKRKWLSSPTHRTPLIWHPVTSSYFQKRN